jgi:hypothetical protein
MASASKIPSFSVPLWVSFFSHREYADFNQMVAAELRARGVDVEPVPGLPTMALPGGNEQVNLQNLAQTCNEHPIDRWPSVIARFFDRVFEARMDPARLLAQLADFDAVRGRIKVRLHAEGYIAPPRDRDLVVQKIADGLLALLVCDFDFANVSVPLAQVKRWGKSADELFALATENVRREPRLQVEQGAPHGELSLDLLAGETHYSSSHLLFFEEYFRGNPRYGALVSVPQRHVILRHAIRDESVLGVVPFMHQAAVDAFQLGPGSISTRIYWWRPKNRLKLLPTTIVGGVVLVAPSQEFQEVVLNPILKRR